jgi:hypothetical protein
MTDSGENQAVRKLLSGYSEGWIGLHQDSSEWSWENSKPLTYAYWRPGEPSGDGNHGAMWGSENGSGTHGTWNDEGNLSDIDSYVCEKERKSP